MRLALLQKIHGPHSDNLDACTPFLAELAAVGGTRPARYMCHTLISNLISIQRTIFSTLISMQHTLLAFQSRSRRPYTHKEACAVLKSNASGACAAFKSNSEARARRR